MFERLDEIKRFNRILNVGASYGFSRVLGKRSRKKEHGNPARLRKAFEELGGSFVKLGQLLSLRPDLIPNPYCEELSLLQDHVKPFSLQEAKHALEEELGTGGRLIELKELVAAASIGQVYRAKIGEEEVAVKIMRPGIEQQMGMDLLLLYRLARLVRANIDLQIVDPLEIYEQFRMYTENELDYLREAQNIEVFARNFIGTPVRIPHVHWQFTTKRVLTMEFFHGKPFYKCALSPREKKEKVREIYQAILKQVFIDGFFHADPHPGNILILDDGSVAFIDFGIVGSLDEKLRKNLAGLFVGLMQKDTDAVVDSFIHLNIVDSDVDRPAFKADLSRLLGKYYGREVRDMHMGELIPNALSIARKNNIRVPKDYILLSKCLMTLEGVCTRMDPNFNLVEESGPFAESLVRSHLHPKEIAKFIRTSTPNMVRFAADLPEKANYFLSEVKVIDDKIVLIERDLSLMKAGITKGFDHVFLGVIVGSLLITAGLTLSSNKEYALFAIAAAVVIVIFVAFSSRRNP